MEWEDGPVVKGGVGYWQDRLDAELKELMTRPGVWGGFYVPGGNHPGYASLVGGQLRDAGSPDSVFHFLAVEGRVMGRYVKDIALEGHDVYAVLGADGKVSGCRASDWQGENKHEDCR